MKPTQTLIKQGLKIAQSTASAFAVNASLKSFTSIGIGRINGRQYLVGRQDRTILRDWLEQQGVDWQMSPGMLTGSRLDISAFTVYEKASLETVSGQRVLLTPLGDGVSLNGTPVPSIAGAHVSVAIAAISDCEAQGVLLVENLAVFQAIHVLNGRLPSAGWIAIFRGAPQDPLGQQWAAKLVREKRIPLITCSDFDPAGLAIALGANSRGVVLPEIDSLEGLKGNSVDFQGQFQQWLQVRRHPLLTSTVEPWLGFLASAKAGFTQERMMKHRVKMTTVWFDDAAGSHEPED